MTPPTAKSDNPALEDPTRPPITAEDIERAILRRGSDHANLREFVPAALHDQLLTPLRRADAQLLAANLRVLREVDVAYDHLRDFHFALKVARTVDSKDTAEAAYAADAAACLIECAVSAAEGSGADLLEVAYARKAAETAASALLAALHNPDHTRAIIYVNDFVATVCNIEKMVRHWSERVCEIVNAAQQSLREDSQACGAEARCSN